MSSKYVSLLLGSVFLAPAAFAQDFSGGLTLGYAKTEVSPVDQDITGLSADGRIAVALGGGFTFGARYNHFNLDVDGTPASVSGDLIGLNVDYALSDAFTAGIFIENAEGSVDTGGPSLGISARTYGLEGHYKTGALDFGAFVAAGDPGGLAGTTGADLSHLGLSAKYAPSEALTLGASAIRTNIEIGGTDVDVDYIGLAGVYAMNDQISLFGGASRSSLDIVNGDVTTFGLGAAYDLSAMAGMPLMASLELARTTASAGAGSDIDVDTVRLGLTVPLGGKALKAPLNSTADAILNPSHSAITQTVLNF